MRARVSLEREDLYLWGKLNNEKYFLKKKQTNI